jgi:hypothetical protein
MRSPYCLCVCLYVYPLINFEMPEPIVVKLGMYIMTPEPITMAYLLTPPISLSYVSPSLLLGKGSVNMLARQKYTQQ